MSLQPENKLADQVRIFVSHKADDKELAGNFMGTLLKYDSDPPKILYFISSFDMSVGKPWPKQVHENLRDSQWLILIYTSPEQDWNWCLYEAGYFAAYVEKNPNRRIFCIHHPNVSVPTPLEGWQNISADRQGIKRLAKFLYKDTEDCLGLHPKLFTEVMENDKKFFFKELHKHFSKKVATKTFVGNCWLKILNEQLPVLQSGKIPEKALISFDDMGKQIFEIGGVEKNIDWKTFIELYLKPDQNIWSSKLARVLQKALTTEVESTFALISDAKRKDFYRPILEEMQYHFNGDISFKFSFMRIPTYFNPESDNNLDKLFHLLSVQQNFRWRIVEKYQKEIEGYINRKKIPKEESYSAIENQEKQLIDDFRFDLADCVQDARNRGLRSEREFLELFKRGHRSKVRHITESGNRICENEMNRPLEKMRLEDLLKSIYQLDKLNREFRKILARTYWNALKELTTDVSSLSVKDVFQDENSDKSINGSY
jgi:hypothetical protein